MKQRVTDHTEIWLEPSCDRCDDEVNHTWVASEQILQPCTKCGRKPVCYVAFAAVSELLS